MQTKPKANSVITHALDGTMLTFMVRDSGNVILDMTKLHVQVLERAAVHGMIQRISDAAAISRDVDTGLPATPAEKLAAMRELVDHYMSGSADWSRTRSGSGESESGLLVQCLMRIKPDRTVEQLKEGLSKLSKAQKSALLLSEQIAPIAAEIRAAAGKGINAEELLSGL